MASTHKHIRSGTANKRPTTAIAEGQIALATNITSPGLFFKDSTGATIVKIGPVHVGATAPNATPAGSAGNSIGEVWLDNSLTPIGVKIYDGSAFVNATPIGSTTVQGLLELATDAETQAGADTARAVTPASLQSKLSDSTSTTSNTTIASSTAVKTAYDLANAALPKTGGTVTGNLEIGAAGSLSFEGATADGFETTIAVVDPTADRTITLPNTTGTIVTTGDTGTVTSTMILDGTIVDADINANAEISVSKLVDGSARQLLQTDAAGTGVEWASNIDIPGTLDVTSAATFDSSVAVTGALTKSGSNVVTVGDTGTVTSTMILDGTILNADVNNTAGIVASKLSFTQAGASAVARTVDSKLKDMVSVKDFGAVGDGVADDTAAIQAAIDSGKAAFVPKGTYKISATLNLNNGYKALIGDASMPIIAKTNAGPAIRIGTTVGAFLNEYSRVENLYLQSLTVAPTFPASPGANDAGVVLDGSSSTLPAAVQNARVINVRVGNWSNGFYTSDVVGCRIEGCFVQVLVDYSSAGGFTASNKFCGFVLDGTPYTPGGISPQASIELVDNDVNGAGLPTSITSKGFYLIGDDIRDVFFDRCETSETSYGWFITTATSDFNWDVQIRRPIVDAFKTHGIFITGANGPGCITIDGGYFVGKDGSAGACIYAVNSNGISVTGGAQLLGLTNDGSTDDGVRFDTCNSCSIVGNSFQNCNYGVSLNGSKNCSIVGNHFFASATATEANPGLYDAIRLFSAAEENTIVGNAIKGKDGTDLYANGVLLTSGCLRNVIVGNTVDLTSVTTDYNISDATTILVGSNGVVHPLGAVATPSITFTGDLDTGIYSPIADTLAFVEGGTEVLRINSNSVVLIGKETDDVNTQGIRFSSLGVGSFARDGEIPLFIHRGTDDGGLVVFRQAGADEGNISVSGTTVSYNGAHLSRWSQLPSGAERVEILRGSVLSNLDEMCEWGNEDNEQLNRMKVSDVEGDPNVAGVFQAWDDDDDTYTNDFYCAMTGDFIIRIAGGITVERGDLLMSAGDGTAKPQDDDIIRSKTVAKVTSTSVSCTYEDGSYCIPCALMAC